MVSPPYVERIVGTVLFGLIALGCFVVLQPFMPAILWAIILSVATWPLEQRAERLFGWRRVPAALAMIALIAAFVLLPIIVLGRTVAADIPRVAQLVAQWLEIGPPPPPAWVADIPVIGRSVSAEWSRLASDTSQITAALAPYVGDARAWLLASVSFVGNAATQLIIALVIVYFLFCHGVEIADRLRVGVQRAGGPGALRALEIAEATIKSVVYGLLGANLVQAILAALSFWAAGIPGAFFLGFACFFLTVIPFAPTVIWLPAALWLGHSGETTAAIALAAWNIFVFPVLEQVLRPLLMARGGDLPMMIVLLGMLGGLVAFGFLGVFLGPTLLAIGYMLANDWSSAPPRALTPHDTRREEARSGADDSAKRSIRS